MTTTEASFQSGIILLVKMDESTLIPFATLSVSGVSEDNAFSAPDPSRTPRLRETLAAVEVPENLKIVPCLESLHKSDSDAVVIALKSLTELTAWKSVNKFSVADHGGLAQLAQLILPTPKRDPQVLQNACWVLMNLASLDSVSDLIASHPTLIPCLVTLLSSGDARTRLAATRAVDSLACCKGSPQGALLAAGAVQPLLAILTGPMSESSDAQLKWSASALRQLATLHTAADTVAAAQGFLLSLESLLHHSAGGVVYYAAHLLATLLRYRAPVGDQWGKTPLVLSATAIQRLVQLLDASNITLAAAALGVLIQIAADNASAGAVLISLPLLPTQLSSLAIAIHARGLSATSDDAFALMAVHELICILAVWPSHSLEDSRANSAGATFAAVAGRASTTEVWARAKSYIDGLGVAAASLGVALPSIMTWHEATKPADVEIAEITHRVQHVHRPALESRNARATLSAVAGLYLLGVTIPRVARYALGEAGLVHCLVTTLGAARDEVDTEMLQAVLPLIALVASTPSSATLLFTSGVLDTLASLLDTSDILVSLCVQRALGALSANVMELRQASSSV